MPALHGLTWEPVPFPQRRHGLPDHDKPVADQLREAALHPAFVARRWPAVWKLSAPSDVPNWSVPLAVFSWLSGLFGRTTWSFLPSFDRFFDMVQQFFRRQDGSVLRTRCAGRNALLHRLLQPGLLRRPFRTGWHRLNRYTYSFVAAALLSVGNLQLLVVYATLAFDVLAQLSFSKLPVQLLSILRYSAAILPAAEMFRFAHLM